VFLTGPKEWIRGDKGSAHSRYRVSRYAEDRGEKTVGPAIEKK